jgi:hypothetical protein
MTLLQKAKPEMAFLKLGIYGEAGSGKTFTSSRVAISLANFIKSKKPVGFADTETGADFVAPLFKAAKLDLIVAKTRAFADLLTIIDEAAKGCDILIIDSVTHFWNELIDSYLKKNEKKRLTLRDWQPLKQTWREFTDRFVNSKLHIIVCGRSADKWEEVEDPDDGSKELRKVGTKMRTETEMGYEPSLLVEMEAVQMSPRTGGKYVHRAYVKKDRFDVIDGQVFDNPDFESFLPHIQLLNLGGEHKAIETDRNSQGMFERGDTGEQKRIRKEIILEKIGNEIKLLHPGMTENDKTARIKLLQEIFGSNSWTEISTYHSLDHLEAGLKNLRLKSGADAEPKEKVKTDKGDGNPKKTSQKEARA